MAAFLALLCAAPDLRALSDQINTEREQLRPEHPHSCAWITASGSDSPSLVLSPLCAAPDLRALSDQINAEREQFRCKVLEAFEPIKALFMRHCDAFVTCAPGWQVRHC